MSRFWGSTARRISPTDDPTPGLTPLHTDIGYKGFRIGEPLQCKWFNTEPTQGNFTLTNLGAMVETVKSAGLSPLYTFGGPPDWACGGDASTNPPDPDAYRTMIARVAQEFPGEGLTYELWNEIDYATFWKGTQEQGIAMMTGAAAIIKAADPSARVVGPSFLYTGAANMQAYLEAGALDGCDALSFHAYCYPSEPEALFTGAQGFVKLAYEYRKPLINTEWTWNQFKIGGAGETQSYPTLMSEDQAASYLVRSAFVLANLRIMENYFFGLDNWLAGNAAFSCIEYADSDDLTVKLGPALAEQYQIGLLGNGGKLMRLSRLSNGWQQDFITNSGATGRAYWCRDGQTRSTDLTAYSSGTDMYGDPITLTSSYSVTSEPIYVFD